MILNCSCHHVTPVATSQTVCLLVQLHLIDLLKKRSPWLWSHSLPASLSLSLFSQSYHLQAHRDMHPSIALDPSANYNSPKFRSRNQSYMRAVSTLSQASCVSQVSQVSLHPFSQEGSSKAYLY